LDSSALVNILFLPKKYYSKKREEKDKVEYCTALHCTFSKCQVTERPAKPAPSTAYLRGREEKEGERECGDIIFPS
jgi:hypothetical protein